MVRIVGKAYKNGVAQYFLSQAKTIESAKKNAGKKYRCKVQTCEEDLTEFLKRRFTEQWSNGNCWLEDFPDFCFPRSDRAGVIPINDDLYRRLEIAIELGELGE